MKTKQTRSKITKTEELELQRIPYPKVQSFVRDKSLYRKKNLSAFKAQCYDPSKKEQYSTHLKTFVIKEELERVWQVYKTIPPQEAWGGKKIGLGFMYCQDSERIYYTDENCPGAEPSQIFFVNLKLLGGLFQMAVAHRIMGVKEEQRLLRICYLEGGKAQGTQYIRFESFREGHTRVIHETKYKSDSRFRDKWIYPFFHGLFISEFHNNIIRKIYAQKLS